MPERVRRPLAAALVAELLVIAALLTVVLDQYAHKRVEQLGGVNSWGYRGPITPSRRPDEFRIAVVGGDHAFGWGVAPGETTAGYLRNAVQGRMPRSGASNWVTAINLGALGLPAHDYASRLAQFAYLAPDVICLYIDLDDTRIGSVMPPYDSAVTAFTGYVPMLPVVLEEKGSPIAVSVGRVLHGLDRGLYHVMRGSRPMAGEPRLESIGRAVHIALGMAPVVVVLPVPMTPAQQVEHARLLQLVQARAQANARLRLVDLAGQPRLRDPGLFLDGVNYGAGGHSLAASEIAPAVVAFVPGSQAQQ